MSSALPGQNQTGVTYSDPAHDTEHQGMINLDYLISSKHTLSSRYFIANEPQITPFTCANCLPGTHSTIEIRLPGWSTEADFRIDVDSCE